jgi:hypothetical protein
MMIYNFSWDGQGDLGAYVLDGNGKPACVEAQVREVPKTAVSTMAGKISVRWDRATFLRYELAESFTEGRTRKALVLTESGTWLQGDDAVAEVQRLAAMQDNTRYAVNGDQSRKFSQLGIEHVTAWGGQ